MTTKSEYTAEEWQLLLDVPTLAGLAVMMSGKSGLGHDEGGDLPHQEHS